MPLVLFIRTFRSTSQSFEWTHWIQSQAEIPPLLPALLAQTLVNNLFLRSWSLIKWILQWLPWKSGNSLSRYSLRLWRMTWDALFLEICEAWRQGKKRRMGLSWRATLLWTGVSLVINTHRETYRQVLPLHCHCCIRDSRGRVTNRDGVGHPVEHGILGFSLHLWWSTARLSLLLQPAWGSGN